MNTRLATHPVSISLVRGAERALGTAIFAAWALCSAALIEALVR